MLSAVPLFYSFSFMCDSSTTIMCRHHHFNTMQLTYKICVNTFEIQRRFKTNCLLCESESCGRFRHGCCYLLLTELTKNIYECSGTALLILVKYIAIYYYYCVFSKAFYSFDAKLIKSIRSKPLVIVKNQSAIRQMILPFCIIAIDFNYTAFHEQMIGSGLHVILNLFDAIKTFSFEM